MALRLFSKRATGAPAPALPEQPPVAPGDTLAAAAHHRRFGRIAVNPGDWASKPGYAAARKAAIRAIDERFALVPDGFASISLNVNGEAGEDETDVATDAFLLARHCVTNAEYQHFVDAGGYEDFELWPQEVWPHLVDFKDLTGKAGPRYWRDGHHDKRFPDNPVVGISYLEAEAYAAWAGARLPTEAEWQMAASWRIRSEANSIRRYPWGDALDLERCNIWYSGHGGTLPVGACPGGAAPNGVLNLIGNVWEWTASDFACRDVKGREIVGDMLMKTIRGGAFDTYFPWQATSTFRSGAACLARAHNIGLRLAMDLFDAS